MKPTFPLICACCALLLLSACSGSSEIDDLSAAAGSPRPEAANQQAWPLTLPADQVLPWEELDSAGLVIPERGTLSFDAQTEFTRGADFDSSGGSVVVNSQGVNIQSGTAGSAQLSYALYRIPLGSDQPGAVAVDANLHAVQGGSGASPYYIGLSDYATGTWEWHGPYTDNHVRLWAAASVAAGADLTSPLGSLFVAVLAFDGSELDVVGVGVEVIDGADVTAPPVPAALGVTAQSGGFLLEWTPSVAADLAGYRVYYSNSNFSAATDAGVQAVDYLEGATQHVFSLPGGGTRFFGIAAVDMSGNESALSNVETAATPAAAELELLVETDILAGKLNSTATLSVSGADNYDFDLDGDGIYEISGSTTPTQLIDTSNTGIIRPGVRGHSSGGAVALGGVSLLVSAGFAPVALLTSDVPNGVIWEENLTVNFDASGSSDVDTLFADLQFSFDPEGDGSFNAYTSNPLRQKIYAGTGVKLAAVKVKDPEGYEDLAYRVVSVYQFGGFTTRIVHLKNGTGHFNSLAEVNFKPAIAYYEPNGGHLMYCRAADFAGAYWNKPVQLDDNSSMYPSLAVIAGNPAIVYYKSGTSELKYIRCGNSDGNTLSAWSNPSIVLKGPIGVNEKPNLIECNGNPAVLYLEGGALKYRRATTANGTGNTLGDWADPEFAVVAAGATPQHQLALITGNPALAYYNGAGEAHYLRATSATGASALDWPAASVKVSGADAVNGFVNLVEANGAPAVCWYDGGINGIKYTRANTATGALLADWPVAVSAVAGPGAGTFSSMAIIKGFPAIAYEDSSMGVTKRYVRALDASGSAWGNPLLVAGQQPGNATMWCSLAQINGEAGIAYHDGPGDCAAYALPDLSL